MIDHLKQRLKQDGKINVTVRVRPRAKSSQLIDVLQDGSMKIAIAAPAEDGKGNAALRKFLGELFGVPATQVEILSGKNVRTKLVRVIDSRM